MSDQFNIKKYDQARLIDLRLYNKEEHKGTFVTDINIEHDNKKNT